MRASLILFILLHHFVLHSQTVRVGTIDVYGNRRISSDTLLKYATIKEGDSIDRQSMINKRIEKSIVSIPGITKCVVTLICCDKSGGYNLFIGVAENDSNVIRYRRPPILRIKLPAKYSNARKNLEEKLRDAVLAGESGEDWTNGYSLIKYPPARRIQEKFARWADEDLMIINKVLMSSSFESERATAAQMIAYNSDKQKAIQGLLHALGDESSEVRNNASRALAVLAYYSSLHPEKKLEIPYQPFTRLINSMIWSDRNKGMAVVMQLTQVRNNALFDELKSTCLPSIIEMARWKSEKHALSAYIVLCRMAGLSENEIARRTKKGDFSADVSELAKSIR